MLIKIMRDNIRQEIVGKRVVELGSGTGLAGLCAAAMGAHVLLTDLKTVHACHALPVVRDFCSGDRLLPQAQRQEELGGATRPDSFLLAWSWACRERDCSLHDTGLDEADVGASIRGGHRSGGDGGSARS
mmetsp:Transcript_43023/g.135939  ORF Transcript_43023/g.135939 Transcript_43023/m.135939 type:complete len:130 (+) Transcript_43023:197-586(+)